MQTNEFYQAIETYFAATRSQDKVTQMVACFAPDAVCHDPVDGPVLLGQDGLRQFFQSITDLFQEVGLAADFIAVNGQVAAAKWTGKGTGKNGRVVVFEGIDVFEFAPDGKFQTMQAYWNPAAMLAMLQDAPELALPPRQGWHGR